MVDNINITGSFSVLKESYFFWSYTSGSVIAHETFLKQVYS